MVAIISKKFHSKLSGKHSGVLKKLIYSLKSLVKQLSFTLRTLKLGNTLVDCSISLRRKTLNSSIENIQSSIERHSWLEVGKL